MVTRLNTVIILKCIEIFESPHCVPGYNSIIGQLYFKTKTHRKRHQICGYQGQGGRSRENWMKVVKTHNISIYIQD